MRYHSANIAALLWMLAVAGIVAGALLLSGCQTVVDNTPTIQYCPTIQFEWERQGNMAKFKAAGECQLPIGGAGVGIPNPLTLIPAK